MTIPSRFSFYWNPPQGGAPVPPGTLSILNVFFPNCFSSTGVEQIDYAGIWNAADSDPDNLLATTLTLDSAGALVFDVVAGGALSVVSGNHTAHVVLQGTELDVFNYLAALDFTTTITTVVPFPQAVTQTYPVTAQVDNAHGSANTPADFTVIASADQYQLSVGGTLDLGVLTVGVPAQVTPTILDIQITGVNADALLTTTFRSDTTDNNTVYDYTPGTETVTVTGQGTTVLVVSGSAAEVLSVFDGSSGAIVTVTALAVSAGGSVSVTNELGILNTPCLVAFNGQAISYTAV